jgi:hypothetical protein
MQAEKYGKVALTTVAGALLFLCWHQSSERMVVRAADQQFTTAGTENRIPMISEQHSESKVSTRMVVDRFNEVFNRHDADALALLLTEDTVFEDTSPHRMASGSRGSRPWSHFGGDGSRATPTQDSRRRM